MKVFRGTIEGGRGGVVNSLFGVGVYIFFYVARWKATQPSSSLNDKLEFELIKKGESGAADRTVESITENPVDSEPVLHPEHRR